MNTVTYINNSLSRTIRLAFQNLLCNTVIGLGRVFA